MVHLTARPAVRGATVNQYWDQLYGIFPDWQFVLNSWSAS